MEHYKPLLLIGEGLKRELSESEFAPSQFHQTIKHRGGIAKARRQILVNPMKDLLEMIDHRDDAENPLDHHAIIALAMLAKAPVDRFVPAFAEAQVTEDFGLLGPSLSNLTQVLVVGVGGSPSPVNDLPLRGNQPAEFDSHNPAMIALAFLANLCRTASLTDGVDQLNAVAINHTLFLRSHQELVGQVLIDCQQAQQARTVRQVGKQVQPVPFEPAIKGAIVDALEGEQHANRDYFTGIQVGILPLVDVRQSIVYHTKESNDDFFGSHWVVLLFAMIWLMAQASHNPDAFSTLLSTSNSGYYMWQDLANIGPKGIEELIGSCKAPKGHVRQERCTGWKDFAGINKQILNHPNCRTEANATGRARKGP